MSLAIRSSDPIRCRSPAWQTFIGLDTSGSSVLREASHDRTSLMPFATSFYRDRRLMITRAWGHITVADVRAYQQELRQQPEFDRTWAHVVDARDAVQIDISSEEIRQLAASSVLAPSARRAMVATDLAIFGLFRMYATLFELHVDGSTVGVFTTLDDAIEWVTP